MGQVAEHGLVEQFVPVLGTPPQDRVTGQFCAVVADNHAGLPAALDQGREITRDTASLDRGVRDCRKAFPGDVIDHVENPEAMAIGADGIDISRVILPTIRHLAVLVGFQVRPPSGVMKGAGDRQCSQCPSARANT